ncbi:MAG: NAD(P)-dependent glycerol-3-phosphate dehydrogenase [Clostridia bacterium]|nr:NAD(P)-dependent glycerol-3-phosphate dehydrogenase [Clostridia bacterium]
MAVITVLGAGGFGTALGLLAHGAGHDVRLWSPFEEEVDDIRRHGEHRKLLPGVPVPPTIAITTDLTAASDAELVILATPSFAVAETAQKLAGVIRRGTPIADVSKGFEAGTYRRLSEIVEEAVPGSPVVALTGPSHAEEVARGVPTSVVSASRTICAAETVQDLLMTPQFRIYVTDDVIGAELGGALKNVVALAAGMCDGLQVGDNTKAALMTRGLSEIARLGTAMGAKTDTFAGLSGMGDLIVTCGSMHSRNRRAGMLIGRGKSPADAVKEVGTVEGYFAAVAAHALAARYGVEMPIAEECYRICYEGVSPQEALRNLMNRPKRHETEPRWVK